VTSDRLVHIVDDVPDLVDVTSLTMVVVLDGFLDAGSSAVLAARHLVEVDPGGGPVVATFDVDAFHDYRARRPAVSFARDHYEAFDAPRLVVRLLHDAGGTPYLLLVGPEPDNRWEAFCRAVREVVERFGVTRVVGMGSVPMAVPHTRPIAITHHANRDDLLSGTSAWAGELRVPSSAQALLEIRLGEWGHAAQGFVAHIPHYLAQLDYPRASAILLEQVERAGRLTLDLDDLKNAADAREDEISRYLSANEEVGEVVASLERQYDAFAESEESGSNLLAEDQPLPTGDEIGQQFEQFLAGLEPGEGDDTGPDDGPDHQDGDPT
jgi:hypothetical protein